MENSVQDAIRLIRVFESLSPEHFYNAINLEWRPPSPITGDEWDRWIFGED
jgi:hypothetical protein